MPTSRFIDQQDFGGVIRPLFSIETGIDFLNNGSFGACPLPVQAAQAVWRQKFEHQPIAFVVEELPGAIRAAAARLAGFLGASAGDVVFVENATAGMNAVLRSLEFAPGDEILTSDHVYGAVRKVLAHLEATRGVVTVEARLPWPSPDADAIVAAIAAKISARTKLLVIDHITSVSALLLPLARIVAVLRSRGIPVLVDGAHAPGQIALDLDGLGADWYVGNCHKWLFAPKGSAFLWARPERQAGIQPPVISHGYGTGFTAAFDWVGTRDPSSWLAVPAGIDFLEGLGVARVRERNHGLAQAMATEIAAGWRTEVGCGPELNGAMATIRVPGTPAGTREAASALRARLWREHRIEVAIMPVGGTLWARISAQVFNRPGDYRGLARVLAAA